VVEIAFLHPANLPTLIEDILMKLQRPAHHYINTLVVRRLAYVHRKLFENSEQTQQ
jgi:hypothetical protein